MLPISDDNRGRTRQPIVTWVLIAVNILIYAYQWTLDDRNLLSFLDQWATVPAEVSSGQALFTLVTCAFLHGSWFHLGSNMLFLWDFGDNVEDVMGHAKYIIFYLLTAAGASYAQVLINPDSRVPLVGASGAVSGLLAGYIVLFPHGKIQTLIFLGIFVTTTMIPAWVMIGYWIVIQVISGVGSLSMIDEQTGGV
ncbi:MAG TPA: rhomboid family intramembrane serine protease, partial [Thermomicrobiales bacterium]|nr:rhomboid family intramembrane serine protease [Thermomicrobiales bacterium]